MKESAVYLVLIILALNCEAIAQNGKTPFAGSTHVYTIAPEKTTNTLQWSVVESAGYTIDSQTVEGENAIAQIKWTAPGSYHLQFSETDVVTGCVAIKEIEVVVSQNTLNVYTSNPEATCNAADGAVNFSDSEITTSISFLISMETGNVAFNPGWEFTFTLESTTGASIENVKAGTKDITADSGTYTVTDLTSDSGNGTVTISLDVTGEVYSEETVMLEITSARELSYNAPAANDNNLTAVQTIDAIPQTSEISTD